MTDFSKDLSEFYDKVGKEIQTLNKKDSLSREEMKAGLDAVCLMHKIRHFEDDGMKYGWNEDGYSQKGWALTEIPNRYPYSYADSRYGNGQSNRYPVYSYNSDRYSRHEGVDDMVNSLEGLNDRDRMAVLEYINRLRG